MSLAARKSQGPSPDPWGVVEVIAQTTMASSNAGGGLEVGGATMVGAEVAVERAAGALDRPFPHRCLQRVCKGEGDRRRCRPLLVGLRWLDKLDGLRKTEFLTGRLDHWGEMVVGVVGAVEKVVVPSRVRDREMGSWSTFCQISVDSVKNTRSYQ